MIPMMIAAAEPRRIVRGHCQCDVSTSTSLFRVTTTLSPTSRPGRASPLAAGSGCPAPGHSLTGTGSVGLPPVSGPAGGSRSLVPNLNASESDAAVTSESSLFSSHPATTTATRAPAAWAAPSGLAPAGRSGLRVCRAAATGMPPRPGPS